MKGSTDDLQIDGIPLDDVERVKHRFKLDEKQQEAINFIRQNLPISGFSQLLGEELWLREILKDLEGSNCRVCKRSCGPARTKALQLLGEWLGILGSKAKKKSKREVIFDED